MSPTEAHFFTVPEGANLSISGFFQSSPLSQWNFTNYFEWNTCVKNKIRVKQLHDNYYSDLNKIRQCKGIPDSVKLLVGRIWKAKNEKSTTNTPRSIYQTISISGVSTINTINNITGGPSTSFCNVEKSQANEDVEDGFCDNHAPGDMDGNALLRSLYDNVYELYKGKHPDLTHLEPLESSSLPIKLYNHCVKTMKSFGSLDRLGKSF
ncbi:unnamed protein product [Absidia cylindrospora]